MAGTGVGTFNDRLRDAVRGGGSFGDDPRCRASPPGSGSHTPLAVHDRIKVGPRRRPGHLPVRHPHRRRAERRPDRLQRLTQRLRRTPPARRVNYVDAHDNEILYDAMAFKLPRGTVADRPGPACRCSRCRWWCSARASASWRWAPSGCGPSRSTATRTTRATGSTRSAGTRADGNGFGLGLPPAADNEDKWALGPPAARRPVPGPAAATYRADRRRGTASCCGSAARRRSSACPPPTRCSAG